MIQVQTEPVPLVLFSISVNQQQVLQYFNNNVKCLMTILEGIINTQRDILRSLPGDEY